MDSIGFNILEIDEYISQNVSRNIVISTFTKVFRFELLLNYLDLTMNATYSKHRHLAGAFLSLKFSGESNLEGIEVRFAELY